LLKSLHALLAAYVTVTTTVMTTTAPETTPEVTTSDLFIHTSSETTTGALMQNSRRV